MAIPQGNQYQKRRDKIVGKPDTEVGSNMQGDQMRISQKAVPMRHIVVKERKSCKILPKPRGQTEYRNSN
jgi:hypothetical protein